CARGIPADVW
nr:immunoglobulin heavy chain junction region [Macaca mulatta]MOY22761.1 immunoglobulin heavy chain junction region [Macaca mulatta]MOY28419.1 immunoglobulin heavy chain junction region [Macaca mulatta]MOY28986.1 immunoglobulin heavy chain junction region [Macaca mulatta]MOY29531.1 immunoglobulin heavy chain junction region [Macaca mulatta]